jgi:hypothetical protein
MATVYLNEDTSLGDHLAAHRTNKLWHCRADHVGYHWLADSDHGQQVLCQIKATNPRESATERWDAGTCQHQTKLPSDSLPLDEPLPRHEIRQLPDAAQCDDCKSHSFSEGPRLDASSARARGDRGAEQSQYACLACFDGTEARNAQETSQSRAMEAVADLPYLRAPAGGGNCSRSNGPAEVGSCGQILQQNGAAGRSAALQSEWTLSGSAQARSCGQDTGAEISSRSQQVSPFLCTVLLCLHQRPACDTAA